MNEQDIDAGGKNKCDKLRKIMDRLEAGIKAVFESEQYKIYLNTLSKFHNYSFNNCILIALQKPEATHVAGYSTWRDNFKRTVKRGEKGIKILAPLPYKIQSGMKEINPASSNSVIGKEDKPSNEKVEIIVPAFRIATVFDISQTEGEPLPEIGVNELVGDVEQYKNFFFVLEKISPVPIVIDNITSGAKGYYNQTEKRIVINEGMVNYKQSKPSYTRLSTLGSMMSTRKSQR